MDIYLNNLVGNSLFFSYINLNCPKQCLYRIICTFCTYSNQCMYCLYERVRINLSFLCLRSPGTLCFKLSEAKQTVVEHGTKCRHQVGNSLKMSSIFGLKSNNILPRCRWSNTFVLVLKPEVQSSTVLMHGNTGQLPRAPRIQRPHANLGMLFNA